VVFGLARRLEIHFIIKRGSWFDIAEVELSVLGFCVLGKDAYQISVRSILNYSLGISNVIKFRGGLLAIHLYSQNLGTT